MSLQLLVNMDETGTKCSQTLWTTKKKIHEQGVLNTGHQAAQGSISRERNTHTHTHTRVPYGTDPEWTNAHTHTHTHRHLCFLWCRDRTQVARAHECWKAESCPGREPGGLAHAPEAPPYTTRESTHREWGAAPGSLKAERSLCFHLSEKKNLLIPRALRRVLPLQRRQKVKPSAVLTTLK